MPCSQAARVLGLMQAPGCVQQRAQVQVQVQAQASGFDPLPEPREEAREEARVPEPAQEPGVERAWHFRADFEHAMVPQPPTTERKQLLKR